MGLATTVLAKRSRNAAFIFKLSKLSFRVFQTGPRPLAITEKVISFVVGQTSGRAALILLVAQTAFGKYRSAKRAHQTTEALATYDFHKDGQVHIDDVSKAIAITAKLQETAGREQALRSAGFLFLHAMLRKFQAGDLQVAARFAPQGVFDSNACLRAFFGTTASRKLAKELKQQQDADQAVFTTAAEAVLLPLVDEAWHEIRLGLLEDAVDFLLL